MRRKHTMRNVRLMAIAFWPLLLLARRHSPPMTRKYLIARFPCRRRQLRAHQRQRLDCRRRVGPRGRRDTRRQDRPAIRRRPRARPHRHGLRARARLGLDGLSAGRRSSRSASTTPCTFRAASCSNSSPTVNGAVRVSGVEGQGQLRSVNGDIDVVAQRRWIFRSHHQRRSSRRASAPGGLERALFERDYPRDRER